MKQAGTHGPSVAEMSVVIVTPDRYETIRKAIRHLRAQTARDRLEVIIVAPSADKLGLDKAELKDFLQFYVVDVGPIRSTAKARAAGIRRASAQLIALVEDHCFPAPGWAEALITAHRQPWAAVGPVMGNANPRSSISWANLLIEYSEWLEPTPAGPVDHLPGHNSSYKKTILLDYGDELEAMLEAESILHWDLRARGHQLYLEPAARMFHLNFSSAFSWLGLRFHGGRLFASARARQWPLARRFLYFSAAPLIPLVRLWRIVERLRTRRQIYPLLPRVLPVLALGLTVDGLGEMVGYLWDVGNAKERLADMEFNRERHLSDRDRRLKTA